MLSKKRAKDLDGAKKARIQALEESINDLIQANADQKRVLVMQGALLSDAADMFEEAGLRECWERHLGYYAGPQISNQWVRIWQNAKRQHGGPEVAIECWDTDADGTDVEAEAQSRRDHGTITAQSGRGVHEPAHSRSLQGTDEPW